MKIRQQRKLLDMTQGELAITTGVSRATIERLENGRNEISIPTAKKLAKFFNCSIDELLNDTPDSTPVTDTTTES